MWSLQCNIEISPSLKAELLGRVVHSPIKLTQDKREFCCNFCGEVFCIKLLKTKAS